MTTFERAEEIAAKINHIHRGPNDPCVIRDMIIWAINQEKRDLELQVRELLDLIEAYPSETLIVSQQDEVDAANWLKRVVEIREKFGVSAKPICACRCHSIDPTQMISIECSCCDMGGKPLRHPVAQKLACDHDWKDARNKYVTSGEICLKCMSIRAGNREG